MNNQPPCIAWAEKLALRYEDLSVADRAALDAHVKNCPACRAAQADYRFLDARLQALPPPTMQPLPRLSPRLAFQREWEDEAGKEERKGESDSFIPSSPRFSRTRQAAMHRGSFAASIGKVLPGVFVAALVLALLLLFESRTISTSIGRPLGTTLFVYQRHSGFVDAVAWSPNGRYIASGGWDDTVQIWNAKTGAEVLSYKMGDIVDAVAWSPDSRYIASGSWDHTVQVWDVQTGTLILTYKGHSEEVSSLAWSPRGRYIASGSWDHTMQVWDARTGTQLFSFTYEDFVDAVAWSPNGRYIAVGVRDASTYVVDAQTEAPLPHIYASPDDADIVNTVAWSPDSRSIAVGGRNGSVQIWDVMTGTLISNYKEHTNEVRSVAWSPDGRYIASGSWDHTVRVWDVKTGLPLIIYQGHSDNVDAVAWSPDGHYIASASWDDTVRVWQAASSG
ncbi:MAG TPA: hypothetical protein VKV40_07690 [Ktedonobacteraceae bacterium]|nr:hypothetical protein [Ktedonobacteraceae bacterium]